MPFLPALSATPRGIGSNLELPFFKTTVNGIPGGTTKLYWDGFELPLSGSGGSLSNTFNGAYVAGGVTSTLYGAFVNGVHYFEAVNVNGSTTSRAAERVVFNLYGNNQIDSDGDGLPDEVEMPNFFAGTAPIAAIRCTTPAPWPG